MQTAGGRLIGKAVVDARVGDHYRLLTFVTEAEERPTYLSFWIGNVLPIAAPGRCYGLTLAVCQDQEATLGLGDLDRCIEDLPETDLQRSAFTDGTDD
ncbi:MAG: hypothetical protein O7H41_14345, partial [Planctomycetota bacterium]|nr:hypothetical protein [Planctomycetota bacterium]